jgi:hypothetical protein
VELLVTTASSKYILKSLEVGKGSRESLFESRHGNGFTEVLRRVGHENHRRGLGRPGADIPATKQGKEELVFDLSSDRFNLLSSSVTEIANEGPITGYTKLLNPEGPIEPSA